MDGMLQTALGNEIPLKMTDLFKSVGEKYIADALIKEGVVQTLEEAAYWGNQIADEYIENELTGAKLSVKAKSPGELRVYDSKGNITGVIDGNITEDIPGSIYDEVNKTVIILMASDDYKYEFEGTDTGEYGLDILYSKGNQTYSVSVENISITTNEIHDYKIDWDNFSNGEKMTQLIDSNGDGTYEETNEISLPTASINYIPRSPVIRQNITFDASSSDGNIISYKWEFGDGVESNDKVVNHSYPTVGLYIINLTVENDNKAIDKMQEMIYVSPYNFTGFFQPVDNLPTLNAVKTGSAIPVKFSLSGNQGLDIFAIGYPASQKITCDSNTPIDDIEETITAGSSSLSYDATIEQYNYVWKTNKDWTGTCRNLAVKLKDGTYHNASFKFK